MVVPEMHEVPQQEYLWAAMVAELPVAHVKSKTTGGKEVG